MPSSISLKFFMCSFHEKSEGNQLNEYVVSLYFWMTPITIKGKRRSGGNVHIIRDDNFSGSKRLVWYDVIGMRIVLHFLVNSPIQKENLVER